MRKFAPLALLLLLAAPAQAQTTPPLSSTPAIDPGPIRKVIDLDYQSTGQMPPLSWLVMEYWVDLYSSDNPLSVERVFVYVLFQQDGSWSQEADEMCGQAIQQWSGDSFWTYASGFGATKGTVYKWQQGSTAWHISAAGHRVYQWGGLSNPQNFAPAMAVRLPAQGE